MEGNINTRILDFTDNNLKDISKCVENGGIVVVPTENVYGFIFSGNYTQTLERVYELKRRPHNKGFVISVTKETIEQFAFLSPIVKEIIDNCWPSSLVVVLDKKPSISDDITGGLNSAAFINLKSPVVDYIVKNVKGPICGTTCNLSGESEIIKCSDAIKYFKNHVDIIVNNDAMLEFNTHSTIISFVEDPPRVLRKGAFSPEYIKEKYVPNLMI